MSATCTILIPTHNRHHFLERCVRWFLELSYPIVIADSSRVEWQSEFRIHERIRYIHMPGGNEVYLPKLQRGLATVETPYIAMCADDDFITAEGLARGIDFLDAHPDYSFSQGYTYFFQAFGTRIVAWPMFYDSHDIAVESWLDRAEQAYSTINYGVNRTDVLRTAIDFLVRQDFTEILGAIASFVDLCLMIYAVKRGKFRRVPVPFGLRLYSPNLQSAGSRPATIVSRNVPDFYRNLLAFLMEGEESEPARNRMLRLFSRDYASVIMYDLAGSRSKKRFVAGLPSVLVHRIEFLYRLLGAVRAYGSFAYFPFLKLFWHPEYRRFTRVVLSTEDE